jgi:hypothetical protein
VERRLRLEFLDSHGLTVSTAKQGTTVPVPPAAVVLRLHWPCLRYTMPLPNAGDLDLTSRLAATLVFEESEPFRAAHVPFSVACVSAESHTGDGRLEATANLLVVDTLPFVVTCLPAGTFRLGLRFERIPAMQRTVTLAASSTSRIALEMPLSRGRLMVRATWPSGAEAIGGTRYFFLD